MTTPKNTSSREGGRKPSPAKGTLSPSQTSDFFSDPLMRLKRKLKFHKIGIHHFCFLRKIIIHGDCSMKDIAGFFHFSSAAATGLADKLVGLELVTRTHPSNDRRMIIVRPTDKAIAIVEECDEEFKAWKDQTIPETQTLAALPPNKAKLDPKTRDSAISRFNTRHPLRPVKAAKMQASRAKA